MIFSPFFLLKLTITSFIFVIIFRSMYVLAYPELSLEFCLFYLISLIALLFGLFSGVFLFGGNKRYNRRNNHYYYNESAAQVVRLISVIWVGLFFVYLFNNYEKIFFKSLTELRYEKIYARYSGDIADGIVSDASYLRGLLDITGFFCVIQFLLKRENYSLSSKIASNITLFLYVVYGCLSGGRFSMVFIVLYVTIFFVFTGNLNEKTKLNKKYIIFIFFTVIFYSVYIAIQRQILKGADDQYVISELVRVFSLSGNADNVHANILNFWVYLTHAINKFYTDFNTSIIFTMGHYSFYYIFYMLSKVGLSNFSIYEVYQYSGHYRGLLGNFYLDFGYFSFVYLYFLGIFLAMFHTKYVVIRDFKYLFGSVTSIIILLLSPIIWVFGSANGFSMSFCSIVYCFLCTRRRFSYVRVVSQRVLR